MEKTFISSGTGSLASGYSSEGRWVGILRVSGEVIRGNWSGANVVVVRVVRVTLQPGSAHDIDPIEEKLTQSRLQPALF